MAAAIGVSSRSDRVLLGQRARRLMDAGWTCTQCYCRECMKLSRLYSESYCCWSHSSPKLSSTDFMEVFPKVDDCSPFSPLSS